MKENLCIAASFAGCIVVALSALFLSAWLFVLGVGLMMGSLSVLA